jgi:hypothetical protein
MAVLPPSALSIAVEAITQAVVDHFTLIGLDVIASADTPLVAADRAKAAAAKDSVNFFPYRVAPSAHQAGHGVGDPLMLRLFCLVTAFSAKTLAAGDDLRDIKLLGETIRFLHDDPILPRAAAFLPPSPTPDDTLYRLQAILLAPNMEEINHIWTTQGGDLPYRLSAAYEFALVPVEPRVHRLPGPPVTSARVQVDVVPDAKADLPTVPRAAFTGEARTHALEPPPGEPPLAVGWIPELSIQSAGRLVNIVTLPPATTNFTLGLALAGEPGGRARLRVVWRRADDTTVGAGSTIQRTIATGYLGAHAARFDQALTKPATAVKMQIQATAAMPDGSAIPGALGSSLIEVLFGP